MEKEKLQEILDKHCKWLYGEEDGERATLHGIDLRGVDLTSTYLGDADLCSADLRGADLSDTVLRDTDLRGADLSDTDLRGADLREADLSDTDLRDADLSGTDLRGANLCGANLCSANLSSANLCGADLGGADLRCTDLRGVNLSRTDLRGVNISYVTLSDANLYGADLRTANLRGTNLRGADLRYALYMETMLNLQCPEEGSFVAWKKLEGGSIAKLLIPEDAKRSSATTRKCRASKAVVLAIYDKYGVKISEGRSEYDYRFAYRVGETVYSDSWDEDRWNECSNGIHFFITRKEAEEY